MMRVIEQQTATAARYAAPTKRFNGWAKRGGACAGPTGTPRMPGANEARFIVQAKAAVLTGECRIVRAEPPKPRVPGRVTVAVAALVGGRVGKRDRIKAVRG